MRMTDGAGQGVGCIGTGISRQAQKPAHHFLHLFFFGVAFADHRLLHLQRRIFRNRQVIAHRRTDRRAARFAQKQRGLRIDIDEHFFHCHLLRLILGYHFTHAIQYDFEAQRQFASRCFDAAAGDVIELFSGFIQYAESGDS